MIAGRLHWRGESVGRPTRQTAAIFEFERGTLTLTEAGTKKRASLHLLKGREALRAQDPGGIEVRGADLDAFRHAFARENHTLKRALTDPRILSGIGNAYSDEILHRARLSPFAQTQRLSEAELRRLHEAIPAVLDEWTAALDRARSGGFPEKVTAFRPGMAVHGRYGKPCPTCGSAVQRIRYASHETNYCPRCQTDGRLLADRSLSRLLKQDWPRTIDELERLRS
jgi:formamidopyrimidine-DNA glycosylase